MFSIYRDDIYNFSCARDGRSRACQPEGLLWIPPGSKNTTIIKSPVSIFKNLSNKAETESKNVFAATKQYPSGKKVKMEGAHSCTRKPLLPRRQSLYLRRSIRACAMTPWSYYSKSLSIIIQAMIQNTHAQGSNLRSRSDSTLPPTSLDYLEIHPVV